MAVHLLCIQVIVGGSERVRRKPEIVRVEMRRRYLSLDRVPPRNCLTDTVVHYEVGEALPETSPTLPVEGYESTPDLGIILDSQMSALVNRGREAGLGGSR